MEIFKKLQIGKYYFISNLGNIKTVNWKNTSKESILKLTKDSKGYLKVGLMINGKLKTFRVHRLVAFAFIPNPENKSQINHINAIKTDNRVENLEWCTNRENSIHQRSLGIQKSKAGIKRGELSWMKGSKNHQSKLTELQVMDIRKKFKPYVYTRVMLANEYNVSEYCIKDVLSHKSWKQ